MRGTGLTRKYFLLGLTLLVTWTTCKSNPDFKCLQRTGDPFPPLPNHYSTNIRLNFMTNSQSVEIRQVVNQKEDKMALEFWYPNGRHIKYIYDRMKTLIILDRKESSPLCTYKFPFTKNNIFEEEHNAVGKLELLKKVMEGFNNEENIPLFHPAGAMVENGVFVKKWEGCLKYPRINISVGFTEKKWGETFTSTLLKDEKYPVVLDVQLDETFLTALFSNFNPGTLDDLEFQPPPNVHCDGYQKQRPGTVSNYFSYDSEILVYESSFGIAPVVSQRKVYYDFPAGISRTDFYDPLAEDQDLFSTVRARGASIIHDFNAGIQYKIDPISGDCKVDSFQATVGPIKIVESKKGAKMFSGDQFFSLNSERISYIGQYRTRGFISDAYTARIKDKDIDYVYTWYFSTNRTQVVERESVEKNVLLRLVVHPEAGDGQEGEVDVNFYNFLREEPDPSVFDIRSCYDGGDNAKSFVLTFPAIEELKGLEKLLKSYIHTSLKVAASVSKQRIFVSEVAFSGNYMYCEFKLLAAPNVFGKTQKTDYISLDQATAKLKQSVADQTFNVSILTKEKLHTLRAEPDGLNELAGDRRRNDGTHYKEGSVIALTIGMLFLGIILGAVTLNLIVSRKFGVSLFQKSNYDKSYSDDLRGESSM